MKHFAIDEQFLLNTTQKLIQINTVNEPPKITNYAPSIEYINKIMTDLGMEVTVKGKENFPNIIGRLKGNVKSNRSLMYNAHLDTVPTGDVNKWEYHPFSGDYIDGYIYGRGACDMSGQIAMLLTVVKCIKDNNINFGGELAVSFVSGHETGSVNGSVYLVENYPEVLKADMCFIPEPSSSRISVSSRGIFWIKATTKGRSGHTAVYNEVLDDGTKIKPINSIHKMVKFINHILEVDNWMTYNKDIYLGEENGMYSEKPIVEVNIINAGDKQNTVPDECSAIIDIRYLPGQTPEEIMGQIEKVVEKIKSEDSEFNIKIETDMIQDPPLSTSVNSDIVHLANRNYKKIFNKELQPCGICAPGDAVAFGRIMPVVWLGPKWDNAHGYNEKVSFEELKKYTQLYISIVQDYLK